jgi:hypothetical protein
MIFISLENKYECDIRYRSQSQLIAENTFNTDKNLNKK